MSLPPNGIDTILFLIAFAKEINDVNLLNALFSRAVIDNGTENEDIWLQYIEHVTAQGNVQKAHLLYQDAMKTLENPSNFVLKYNELKK